MLLKQLIYGTPHSFRYPRFGLTRLASSTVSIIVFNFKQIVVADAGYSVGQSQFGDSHGNLNFTRQSCTWILGA